MIHVVVRDLAGADVKKAQSWYARDDQRRGFQFVEDFSRTVERIGALPDQFPEVGNGVRRALLHDFPYAITSCVERMLRSSSRFFINVGDQEAGNLGQNANDRANLALEPSAPARS